MWTEQAVWAGLPATAGPHACHSQERAHGPDIGCRWHGRGPWLWGWAPRSLCSNLCLFLGPRDACRGGRALEGGASRVWGGELVPHSDLRVAGPLPPPGK